MCKRVKQVLAALTARVDAADKIFLNENLTESEQIMFFQMNLPDQRHVLNVAYTALRLAEGREDINPLVLVKCALLHDVGKVKGDVSTFDKVITVIGHALMPAWTYRWGRFGRGNTIDNLRHACFIYFHHPERSADMVMKNGTAPRIAEIIRKHHKAPAENDPPELCILRQADELH